MLNKTFPSNQEIPIKIPVDNVFLEGNLFLPAKTRGVVIFAHGSGSGRFSPRNRKVAEALNKENLGTLLFDLLTPEEEIMDNETAEYRFDIPLLAMRLIGVTDWLCQQKDLKQLNIGYFGASTGAGAALIAAAQRPEIVKAVVSRGGRPDLADVELPRVKAPTLLIVGEWDDVVISLNRKAQAKLQSISKLEIVPGATHLFEESGTLDEVVKLASGWFKKYLI